MCFINLQCRFEFFKKKNIQSVDCVSNTSIDQAGSRISFPKNIVLSISGIVFEGLELGDSGEYEDTSKNNFTVDPPEKGEL